MELQYNLRLRRAERPRIAYASANALDRPEMPLVLASSVALVVLSSAAEVGGGEGLLRGHVYGMFVRVGDLVVVYIGYNQRVALKESMR